MAIETFSMLISDSVQVIVIDSVGNGTVVTLTGQQMLDAKKVSKPKRSTSAGRRWSRMVSLVTHVARHGKWANGRPYPIDQAIIKLHAAYWSLEGWERMDITGRAVESLKEIYKLTGSSAIDELISDLIARKGAISGT